MNEIDYKFPDIPIWFVGDDSSLSIYSKRGNGGTDSRDWDNFDVLTLDEAVALSLGFNPLRIDDFWSDRDNYGTQHIGLYYNQLQIIYRALLSGTIKTVGIVEDISGQTLLHTESIKNFLSTLKPTNRIRNNLTEKKVKEYINAVNEKMGDDDPAAIFFRDCGRALIGYKESDFGLIDRRIAKIIEVTKSLSLDPMCIPEGNKQKIKKICLKDSELFNDSGFDRAWKEATNPKKVGNKQLIRMKNKEKYI